MTQIKFGTDGWRGLIADDFTFENVRRVAQAIAAYVLKHENPAGGVVIGYDTRFLSDRAARIVAEVIAGAGIPVLLANDYVPTPAVSYNVKKLGAAGGVMVTSSHNPWNWNGVKFKAKFGGSATPSIMKSIEEELATETSNSASSPTTLARIEEVDLKPAYVEAISEFADLGLISRANFKFAIDSMYGSGRGVLPGIFDAHGIRYVAIRQEVNPLFPGINPEPILPHVALLQETVVKEKCHAGLVTDGDADRIGAVAEDGSFVDSHKCMSVLLNWLLVRKKWPGDVVRAFNTTGMMDRIAARYGRKLHETSIGFKYIADLMMEHEILIGGEESGGIGYGRFLPERDGILNALLLANVMAEEGKPLGQLVADLQREFGAHYYGRRDLHISDEMKNGAIRRAADPQTLKLGSYSILRKENRDGIKFYLDAPKDGNGADPWVLFRASGTERLLRCYVEAASRELVEEILEAGERFVRQA
ncbi:MAG TPA: phosphoglucomutase/phosphomannomutase family protein [Terriglobales bacterium]|jgi:alpha-D-glucose phosphate-specific phosphoglucomutase|nr:phosphoglucomutase/phosphomannomutase family protein [Terriglobales bacterium]